MPMPRTISKAHLPELSLQQTQEIHEALGQTLSPPRPRPAIRRAHSSPGQGLYDEKDEDPDVPFEEPERALRSTRMREAFERGKRLEDDERSAPPSGQTSPTGDERSRQNSITEQIKEDPDENFSDDDHMPSIRRARAIPHSEAERLVRRHTRGRKGPHQQDGFVSGPPSGASTPTDEHHFVENNVPRPDQFRGGILSSLLKLYDNQHDRESSTHSRSSSMGRLLPKSRSRQNSDASNNTPQHSPPDSGGTTPNGRHWFSRKQQNRSSASLAQLIGSSASLTSPALGLGEQVSRRMKEQKEQDRKSGMNMKATSTSALAAFNRVTGHQKRLEEKIQITVHIAETIARQRYLMRLCSALMLYGAPTHRLEEYMRMSARVLEIDAQFLYIPGSMIMSFDDSSTHTTEVKLVRVAQGLDLGRLRDVHEVYKDVVHDRMGVEEATARIKEITSRNPRYSRWIRIPVYGLAAVCVGPFAFEARLIDLPIAFLLGCILGILQLIVAPASDLYANVFEIVAAVITSFLARAFGSIYWHGDHRLFCFSALAQSSIALILPGYIVLCASLELQSKQIVAGSIRMVYAIIYSLFLGYGITIGTAIYGLMDDKASSETTCPNPLPSKWNFLFVPGFALCLVVINQGKIKQAPVMLIIALVGYVTSFFSSRRFVGNTQISSTLGALVIGVLANSWSRIGGRVENWCLDRWEDDARPHWRRLRKRIFTHDAKRRNDKKLEEGKARSDSDASSQFERQKRKVGYGLAAAAMLPAIFVAVPSGLSVNGSLVAGIASANQITGSGNNGSTVATSGSDSTTNSIAFTVSYSVVQVAIGITVGLFLSAIVVYPFGKRRSGLFSL